MLELFILAAGLAGAGQSVDLEHAPRLIAHYDVVGKGSLTAREIDFDAKTFAGLDRNGDGRLDRAELLVGFGRAPDRVDRRIGLGQEILAHHHLDQLEDLTQRLEQKR